MKIIGFEMLIYTVLPGMGRVLDYRIEYGASPIRDRDSLIEKCNDLRIANVAFSVHPIESTNMV